MGEVETLRSQVESQREIIGSQMKELKAQREEIEYLRRMRDDQQSYANVLLERARRAETKLAEGPASFAFPSSIRTRTRHDYGPWRPLWAENGRVYGIESANGSKVVKFGGIGKPLSTSGQGNAALMLAAPEMYDALRAVNDPISYQDAMGRSPDPNWLSKKIRNALALAELDYVIIG